MFAHGWWFLMRNNKSIAILYHFANEAKALLFKDRFKKVKVDIHLFPCGQFPSTYSEINDYSNLIILISDNFLKSAFCLNTLINLKSQNSPINIVPILIDGVYVQPQDNKFVFEKTDIANVDEVEKYNNYWKSKKAFLQQKYSDSSLKNQKGIKHQLDLVSLICNEFDSVIHFLNHKKIEDYDRMTKNNFKYLFEKLGEEELFETYKRVVGFKNNLGTPIINVGSQFQIEHSEEEIDSEVLGDVDAKEDIELKMHSGDIGNLLKEKLEYFKSSSSENIGEGDSSPNEFTKLYKENPSKSIKYLKNLIKTGHFENLESVLLTMLDEDMFDEKLHSLLGYLYEKEGHFEKAYLSYKNCVSLNADSKNIYKNIALNYSRMKISNDKQLLKYWKKAFEQSPKDKIVLKSYIHILFKRKKYKKAISVIKLLLKLEPNNKGALKKMIKAYTHLGKLKKVTKYSSRLDSLSKKVDVEDTNPEEKKDIPDFIKDHLKGISEEVSEELAPEEILDDSSIIEDDLVDEFDDEIVPEESIDSTEVDDDFVDEAIIDDEAEAMDDNLIDDDVIDEFEKVCFITGATSGIGEATAVKFAQNGYNLIITGRRKKRLKILKTMLEESFDVTILALSYDIRNAKDCKKAVKETIKRFGIIDVLVNNAGLAKGLDGIDKGKFSDWNAMIDTNIKGLMYMSKYVSKHMIKNGFGQIINIGSIAGKEVYPNGNLYCASKHAVVALTKAMRIDLHKYNIRVGSVNPGHVENTEFALVRFDNDKKKAKIYNDFKPLSAEDVADIIFYMNSVPEHINILDVDVTSTQQANATIVNRDGREDK